MLPEIGIVVSLSKRIRRKKKIHLFKPDVQNVRYRSLFANNFSKKFIVKELYYYDNLSSTLVSCIVMYYNFQITEKIFFKIENKGRIYGTHLYNIEKGIFSLKNFLWRHAPETTFLAAQNCLDLVSKVPLLLQISIHELETQA